jgi:thioredoxin reductase (NADPH)
LRCEKILEKRLLAHEKVTVLWDHEIDEVLGDEQPLGVTGARLRNTKTDALQEVEADGIFIAIGHAPATDLFTDQLETKSGGYLVTRPDSTATSIAGVYAAGDVTDDIYRQAVTAAGMGCMAALEAEKYLAEMEAEKQAAE